MKRFLFLFFLLAVLILPSYTYAQAGNAFGNNVTVKLQEKLEAREAKLAEIQERNQNRNQDKTATREARLSQVRQTLIKKFYLNMSKRLWAMIDRLDILISRIDTRIKIIDAETDKDLTAVNADVTKAKDLLTGTRATLVSSDNMIDTATLSASPKESFALIRLNISDIKKGLKEVHKLLVHVIGDLEGLRVGTTKATPTPTP